jgi:hypothetical protein
MRVMHASLAVVLATATVLALGAGTAAASQAATDLPSLLLADSVKSAMKVRMPKVVKGMVIKKVTCTVPKSSAKLAGTCKARFAVARVNTNGIYSVKASMTAAGKLTWSTTKVTCSDAKTGKKLPCQA